MKKGLLALSMALGITLFAGCNSQKATKDDLSIIPLPMEMNAGTGEFKLNEETKILTSSDNKEVQGVAGYLAELLSPATGFSRR